MSKRKLKCKIDFLNDKRIAKPIRELLGESFDGSDEFGVCMSFMFGIASILSFCEGIDPPKKWKFSPGMGGYDDPPEDYPDLPLSEMLKDGSITNKDLVSAGNVLLKAIDDLTAKGLDY